MQHGTAAERRTERFVTPDSLQSPNRSIKAGAAVRAGSCTMFQPALFMLAAGAANLATLPLVPRPVASDELLIPLSDSVKAATFAALTSPPEAPVTIHLACIVMQPFGAPGRCVDAALIDPGKSDVDWDAALRMQALREEPAAAGNGVDRALFDAAQIRVSALHLKPSHDPKPYFEVRLFDVPFSPLDAGKTATRGQPLTTAPLTTKDISFATPIDGSLLTANYPTPALRYSVTANVTLTCEIGETRKLFCAGPGNVVMNPPDHPAFAVDFLFATYQIASTFDLAATDKAGDSVAGKSLTFTIAWRIPAD